MKGFVIKCTAAFVFTLMGLQAFAQPPLNKRDQKRKAEFEAQIEAEAKYEETIDMADQAFRDKAYVDARMLYAEAIQYNPEKEQWLQSKVYDLDILMAKNIARHVDSVTVVQELPPEPEPVEPEPAPLPEPEKPAEEESEPAPEEVIVEKEETPVQEAEPEEETPEPAADTPVVKEPKEAPPAKPVVAPKPKPKPKPTPPKKEVKVKDDFAGLPQGMTEERFDFPDHNVWRIVVKDGIDTIVYKEVKHRWGGKFYFKDDVSISERIWREEVEAFRKKYPTQ